jgi:hypothetical protein
MRKRQKQIIGILLIFAIALVGLYIVFSRSIVEVDTDGFPSIREREEEVDAQYISRSTTGCHIVVLDEFQGQANVRQYVDENQYGIASESVDFTPREIGGITFKLWFEDFDEFGILLTGYGKAGVILAFTDSGDISSFAGPSLQIVSYGTFVPGEWVIVTIVFDSALHTYGINIDGREYTNNYIDSSTEAIDMLTTRTSRDQQENYNVYLDITRVLI